MVILIDIFEIVFIDKLLYRRFAQASIDLLFVRDFQAAEVADSMVCSLLSLQICISHQTVMHWVMVKLPATILSFGWTLAILSVLLKQTGLARIIEWLFIIEWLVIISATFKNIRPSNAFGGLFMRGPGVFPQFPVSLSMLYQFNARLQHSLGLLKLVRVCALPHFEGAHLFFDESFLNSFEAGERWATLVHLLLVKVRAVAVGWNLLLMLLVGFAKEASISIYQIALLYRLFLTLARLMKVFRRAKHLSLDWMMFLLGFWMTKKVCFVDYWSMS